MISFCRFKSFLEVCCFQRLHNVQVHHTQEQHSILYHMHQQNNQFQYRTLHHSLRVVFSNHALLQSILTLKLQICYNEVHHVF